MHFGKGLESYLRQNNAIGMNVKTRLLSFFRDCWFDQNAGIDWLRLLGSKNSETEIKLQCRGVILQSFGVRKVNEITVSTENRNLQVEYNIDTIYSTNYTQFLEVITNA